jgi:hypothetical protein
VNVITSSVRTVVTKPRKLRSFTFIAGRYEEFKAWAEEVDGGQTEVAWKDWTTPDRRLLIGDERYKVFPGLTFVYLPNTSSSPRPGVFMRFAPFVFQTLFEVMSERELEKELHNED